jgi:hypothetical protein
MQSYGNSADILFNFNPLRPQPGYHFFDNRQVAGKLDLNPAVLSPYLSP